MEEEINKAFEENGKVIIGCLNGEFQFYNLKEAIDFFNENEEKIEYVY